jgi:hypothetical protein
VMMIPTLNTFSSKSNRNVFRERLAGSVRCRGRESIRWVPNSRRPDVSRGEQILGNCHPLPDPC